jgi:hypothetical protein
MITMKLDIFLDRTNSVDLRVEVKYAGWSNWQTFAKPPGYEEGAEIVRNMTSMLPSLELSGEFRLVRTEVTTWVPANCRGGLPG